MSHVYQMMKSNEKSLALVLKPVVFIPRVLLSNLSFIPYFSLLIFCGIKEANSTDISISAEFSNSFAYAPVVVAR